MFSKYNNYLLFLNNYDKVCYAELVPFEFCENFVIDITKLFVIDFGHNISCGTLSESA